jgi:Glycoside-hydrolase family GH114
MRSSTLLLCAMTVTACAGTEGDVLRSIRDGSIPDAPIPDAPTPDARPPGDAPVPRPRPEPLTTWQIQLSGTLDTMVDARVYISDLNTSPTVIRGRHNAGRIVICYFSGGTMERFRDEDASRFPEESLGMTLSNYPDERWIDVRHAAVRAIMQDRIAKAARVECDGIHPSGLAAFANPMSTGLDFSRADQLAYNRFLADAAHALGLSIGLVDGDASLSEELVADFDWRMVFGCIGNNCPSATPFVQARKAAFLVEYGDQSRVAEVCPKAKTLGLSAIIKRSSSLDAFRVGCP